MATDGNMNRSALMIVCFLSIGCAGRLNTDLLQARIRDQSVQLADKQREITKANSELKSARLEAERLRSELKHASGQSGEGDESFTQVNKVHIFPLASGGLNRDNTPGDDAIVVQFAPLDSENEPIKLPGKVNLVLVDPKLPEDEQELGHWSFSADECRSRWTRGLTSSGYQFTLPIEPIAQHSELVVKLHFEVSKDQRYEATQIVKIVPPKERRIAKNDGALKKLKQLVDEIDESLPPVGVDDSDLDNVDAADWDQENAETRKPIPTGTLRDSTNWTEATIPVL